MTKNFTFTKIIRKRKITQKLKTNMSATTDKEEIERLRDKLKEKESDNDRLRQQTIVGMFSSLETLIKVEIEKVYLRLDTIIGRIDSVNSKQETIEKVVIPQIKIQIKALEDHTLRCPAPNGVVRDLEKKVDDHIAKTKWTVDIVYYKWVIRLMILFFFGKSTFDIVLLIFK